MDPRSSRSALVCRQLRYKERQNGDAIATPGPSNAVFELPHGQQSPATPVPKTQRLLYNDGDVCRACELRIGCVCRRQCKCIAACGCSRRTGLRRFLAHTSSTSSASYDSPTDHDQQHHQCRCPAMTPRRYAEHDQRCQN
jgi:hypothetical protein